MNQLDAALALYQAVHRANENLAPDNLTVPLAALLRVLVDGPLSLGAVAQATCTQPPTLTDLADRVERRGLVSRQRAAADRRSVLLSLTPHGHELVARLQAEAAAD